MSFGRVGSSEGTHHVAVRKPAKERLPAWADDDSNARNEEERVPQQQPLSRKQNQLNPRPEIAPRTFSQNTTRKTHPHRASVGTASTAILAAHTPP